MATPASSIRVHTEDLGKELCHLRALAIAKFPNIQFVPKMSKSGSYYITGQVSNDVLEHERIHLQIAEHVAARFSAFANATLLGTGLGVGSKTSYARIDAKNAAKNDLVTQFKKMHALMQQVESQMQIRYDTETDFGRLSIPQADWKANWQQKLDGAIPMP